MSAIEIMSKVWVFQQSTLESALADWVDEQIAAYHLLHTIRYQLKAGGIDLSWQGIQRQLAGQERVTVTLKRADGKTIHVRKTTRPEPWQQKIYDALGIADRPGKTEKTVL